MLEWLTQPREVSILHGIVITFFASIVAAGWLVVYVAFDEWRFRRREARRPPPRE